MRIHVWDTGFVRARRADLHPLLAHLPSWPVWWPGLQGGDSDGWLRAVLRPPGRVGDRPSRFSRPQHLTMVKVKDRPDLGITVEVTGDLVGTAEWYYADEPEGTVVHYVAHFDAPDRRWRGLLRGHRASVRGALHALKDRLEGGRPPGAEPDPRLREDQRAAAEAVRREAQAHHDRLSALRPTTSHSHDSIRTTGSERELVVPTQESP